MGRALRRLDAGFFFLRSLAQGTPGDLAGSTWGTSRPVIVRPESRASPRPTAGAPDRQYQRPQARSRQRHRDRTVAGLRHWFDSEPHPNSVQRQAAGVRHLPHLCRGTAVIEANSGVSRLSCRQSATVGLLRHVESA